MKPTFLLSSILLLMFHVLTTGQTTETRIDSVKLFQVTGSSDSILIEDGKYHYDPYGNCSDYYIDYYAGETGEWYRTFTEIKTYDKYGKLISNVEQGTYPDYKSGSKSDFLFDDSGEATGAIQYFWDKAAENWYIAFRDAFTLNSFGEIDTSYRYQYDSIPGEWSLFSIWVFQYNENLDNVVTLQYRPREDTSDWVPYLRYLYSYDSNHREILNESNHWDSTSNAWLNVNKKVTEYDSIGNKTMWENLRWDDDAQCWTENTKNLQNFDLLGNLNYMEFLVWNEESANYETFVSLRWEFNETGSYKEEIVQRLNLSTRIYENEFRTEHYFDSRGTEVIQHIFSWNTSFENWDLVQRRYLYHSYQTLWNETICEGKPLSWEGKIYYDEGEYSKIYQAVDGKDSIQLLNLYVNPAPASLEVIGDTAVNEHQQYTYSVPWQEDITYGWIVENGILLSEPDSSGIVVRWGFDGAGVLGSYLVGENGCSSDTTSMEILILNTMVKDAPSELSCKVYPNPANSQLFLEFENLDQEVYSLIIYSNQGKKLYQIQKIIGEQIHIDVSKYESGIYLFNLKKEGEEAVYRGKFVVM